MKLRKTCPFLSLMQQTKGQVAGMKPDWTTAMLGFGGGLGGGGSINNITSLVGSNIGANTGVAEINADVDADQPVTIPGGPDTDGVGTACTPAQPQPPHPEAIDSGDLDYTKDLSRQEAVGKANQL